VIAKAKQLKTNSSVRLLCQIVGVSPSGFYCWRKRPKRSLTQDEKNILNLFERHKGKLGTLRLKMAFERQFKREINHKKIRRIKRKFGLVAKVRRRSKFRAIFRKGEESRAALNLVQRNFSPSKNEIILSTDITELRYGNGQKAYLSAVKDLRTKEIITHSLSGNPSIELALGELPAVLGSLPAKLRRKIIIHSDQGGQYTSPEYIKQIENLEVTVSMSRKGNCLDNAPIESFFGHLKDEADYKACKNLKELKDCIRSYMKYYNFQRPQWGLKRKTPAEAGVNISLVF
jgi:putative transposase